MPLIFPDVFRSELVAVAIVCNACLSYTGFFLLGTNTKAMTNNTCLKSLFWSVMWGGLTPAVLLVSVLHSYLEWRLL